MHSCNAVLPTDGNIVCHQTIIPTINGTLLLRTYLSISQYLITTYTLIFYLTNYLRLCCLFILLPTLIRDRSTLLFSVSNSAKNDAILFS